MKSSDTSYSSDMDLDNSVYVRNGFEDREDYLNSLREEYGAAKVNLLIGLLPASEDFDGLITDLQDLPDLEDEDYADD